MLLVNRLDIPNTIITLTDTPGTLFHAGLISLSSPLRILFNRCLLAWRPIVGNSQFLHIYTVQVLFDTLTFKTQDRERLIKELSRWKSGLDKDLEYGVKMYAALCLLLSLQSRHCLVSCA